MDAVHISFIFPIEEDKFNGIAQIYKLHFYSFLSRNVRNGEQCEVAIYNRKEVLKSHKKQQDFPNYLAEKQNFLG